MPKFKRKFILVTADFSGLGFALQEMNNPDSEVIIAYKPKAPLTPEQKPAHMAQGNGLVKKYPLDVVMAKRDSFKKAFWVFDGNHNIKEGETLHREGFRVWNGTKFQFDMENDRGKGIAFAESVGLHSPPFEEFKTAAEGIKFLQANPDKAYVFKPNKAEDSALTQPFTMTPESKNANLECQRFIASMGINDFILQERKKGVEVNTELFYSRGVPVLAQVNLESKRRSNGDRGYMTGCAMDVCWKVSLDAPIIKKTCGLFEGKLPPLFTGFVDTNVIFGDSEVWFLEFCFRTGYNAHPNFFTTISRKTYLQTVADLIMGHPVDARDGFGASVTLFTDKPHLGVPVYVPESVLPNFFLYDGFRGPEAKEPGDFSMGGIEGGGHEIALVTAHNYTIETAFEDAIANAERVKYVNKDHRTDCARGDFFSSPLRRYQALQALHLI